jgi:hypothetical protein
LAFSFHRHVASIGALLLSSAGGLTTQAKNPMVGRAAIYPTKTIMDNAVNLKDHNTGRGDHGNGSWQSPVVSGSHNLPLTFMLQYIISSTARARNAQR